MDTPSTALGSEWLSFHLGYPTRDLDRLLTELVRPTLRSLWREEKLASFFFLRHVVGGSHLRLRIRPSPGHREDVRQEILELAATYLAAARQAGRSSTLSEEAIHEIPFEPEIERYGGAERIGLSLDFFALSSARVLPLLDHRSTVTAGEWLTIALRLEARYILGFSHDLQDLKSLLADSGASLEKGEALLRDRADRAFADSRDRLVALLRGEIEKLGLAALSPLEDGEVARSFRQELADTDRATRTRIFSSQVHMAVNRMGVAQAEEAYLARILWRTFERLEEADSATWSDLADLLVCRTARDVSPAPRLAELLAPAFATL